MASTHTSPRITTFPPPTSAVPLTPGARSPLLASPPQPPARTKPAPLSPSAAELENFALNLARPTLPFTAQLMPSPPPSPCRATTFSTQGGAEAGPSSLPKPSSAAAAAKAGRPTSRGPPRASLPSPPPLMALPNSPPPSPPLGSAKASKRTSRSDDVAALSASLARSFSADSAASLEDEFDKELATRVSLLFPLPPNRHSMDLPPSPPRTASRASSHHSKAASRLSTASAASIASGSSSAAAASPRQFHLPRLPDTAPRAGATATKEAGARPMSFDQATLAAARSRKEGGMVDKRWSEGSPRVAQGEDDMEENRKSRLSQLDFGF